MDTCYHMVSNYSSGHYWNYMALILIRPYLVKLYVVFRMDKTQTAVCINQTERSRPIANDKHAYTSVCLVGR